MSPKPAILCVDDEPNVLSGLRRHLVQAYDVSVAERGAAGLEILEQRPEICVVVSDFNMPEMDGIAFLEAVARRDSAISRVLLTGNADLEVAKRAVNDGNVYRFLTKPCGPEELRGAIRSAVELNRLVNAERELLERTLRGAVDVLGEVLALVNPAAFGRARRLRRYVSKLSAALGVEDAWKYDICATLSQIGCVTVPADLVEKAATGQPLSSSDRSILRSHPTVGERLLREIPRLEDVAAGIRWQAVPYDGRGAGPGAPREKDQPFGARLLRVALSLDEAVVRGTELEKAIADLQERSGEFDPEILAVLRCCAEDDEGNVREVQLGDLIEGMEIAEDLVAPNGTVLVAAGQPVSFALIERLKNWADRQAEPFTGLVSVVLPAESA